MSWLCGVRVIGLIVSTSLSHSLLWLTVFINNNDIYLFLTGLQIIFTIFTGMQDLQG